MNRPHKKQAKVKIKTRKSKAKSQKPQTIFSIDPAGLDMSLGTFTVDNVWSQSESIMILGQDLTDTTSWNTVIGECYNGSSPAQLKQQIAAANKYLDEAGSPFVSTNENEEVTPRRDVNRFTDFLKDTDEES